MKIGAIENLTLGHRITNKESKIFVMRILAPSHNTLNTVEFHPILYKVGLKDEKTNSRYSIPNNGGVDYLLINLPELMAHVLRRLKTFVRLVVNIPWMLHGHTSWCTATVVLIPTLDFLLL